MKGRKKIEKTESMSKQEQIRIYTTSDGVKFEIDYEYFKRVSPFVKNLEAEATTFSKIDSQTLKYIVKYIDIRKQNPEFRPIESPLPSTLLAAMVDKPEVELIQEIKNQGWGIFEKVLDAANYLQIEYLKELLLASLAVEIISKDKQTLKSQLGVSKETEIDDGDKMKEEMRAIIKQIKK